METPLGLRKLCAPSRHSGDSSLSPKLPSSSLTMMSACSGAAQLLMSAGTNVTRSPHLHSTTYLQQQIHNSVRLFSARNMVHNFFGSFNVSRVPFACLDVMLGADPDDESVIADQPLQGAVD